MEEAEEPRYFQPSPRVFLLKSAFLTSFLPSYSEPPPGPERDKSPSLECPEWGSPTCSPELYFMAELQAGLILTPSLSGPLTFLSGPPQPSFGGHRAGRGPAGTQREPYLPQGHETLFLLA